MKENKILKYRFVDEVNEKDLVKIKKEFKGFNEISSMELIPTSAISINGEIPMKYKGIKIFLFCDDEKLEELRLEISRRLQLLNYVLDETFYSD